MNNRADLLLIRWCREGAVDALEDLFDCAAPRLLKVAIHLVGDAVEAEDLVQATFLAVIEGRERVDTTRPAMPWLMGILANKASDVRRKAAREIDPERLAQRLTEHASRPAEQRELSGLLADAIDRLEEPYRQVLILRLRHGMALPDIAHVLERSPGTLRVQMHRAHQKLRDLLPATLTASLAVLLLPMPGRGLASVKALVSEQASLATAGSAAALSTSLMGAWIVNQKIALAGAAAAALIALAIWSAQSIAPIIHEGDVVSQANGLLAHEHTATTETLAETSNAEARTALLDSDSETAADSTISGKVVDAVTGEPISGAHVELHAPRRMSMLQALRSHPELYSVRANGVPRPRTWADWPDLGKLSGAERFGVRDLTLYDLVPEKASAVASCTSAEDGSFTLPAPLAGGILLCEHEDYGSRTRPVRDPAQPCTIALFAEREFSGRVLYVPGRPPAQPLTLVFSALRTPAITPAEGGAMRSFKDSDSEGLGIWTVTTDEEGYFSVLVAADEVMAEVLDEGWRVQSAALYTVGEQATVPVVPRPVLYFIDAESKAPIERVHLLGREQHNSYVRWSGEFHAPDGRLTLPGDGYLIQLHAKQTLVFTVWATGYLGASLSITDLKHQGLIVVPLTSGDLPGVHGTISRSGKACAAVEVALLGHSREWRADEDSLVEATLSNERGAFAMQAPEGDYILRVQRGDTLYFDLIHIPRSAPLDLDLDSMGQIEVAVVDAAGQPQPEHTVVLRGADGRSLWVFTDEQGKCSFENLPPASFKVMAPNVTTKSSFSADQILDVELTQAEQRSVRIIVPIPLGTRYARIVAGNVADLSSWRARYGSEPLRSLAVDGTLPMDLSTEEWHLEIVAPDTRRWSVPIPKTAPDGHEIQLDMGSASYRGVLLDAHNQPIAGNRLFATPTGQLAGDPVRVTVSCVTDASGGFTLAGLLPVIYRMEFRENTQNIQSYDYGSDFKGMSFMPNMPAGQADGLEISLIRARDTVRIHGMLRRELDGSPLAGATIFFECVEPQAAGGMRLGGDKSVIHSDAEGKFEIMLPRTAQRTLRVYSRDHGRGPLLTEVYADSGAAQQSALELIVP